METWHLILYTVAAFLALRSLVSLMANHRHQHKQRLIREFQQGMQRQQPAESDTQPAAMPESVRPTVEAGV